MSYQRFSALSNSRVPLPTALAALPVAFVVIQLGSQVGFDWVFPLARRLGATPESAQAYATLAAMAAGSMLLLLVATLVPLVLSIPIGRAFAVRPFSMKAAGWAALGTLALSPLADFLMGLMSEFFPDRTLGSVPMLHDLAQQLPPWLIWPVFALLPGVAEEAFFRGLLLNAFRAPLFAILGSGLCFSAFHVDPHHVAGVLPLGLYLSWAGYRHGVQVTMVAHVINNSVALLSVHFAGMDVGYGTSTPMPLTWLPLGLVVCGLASHQLSRVSAEK